MLITKNKRKLFFFVFYCFVFFVFSLILDGGASSPLSPFHRSSSPEKKTTQRTILRQFTATSPFGCTQKFWTISDFTRTYIILWPQPRKFCKMPFFWKKKKNKFRKFTSAVFAPDQQTAAQNTLRHQKPLFFPQLSPLQHQGGHAAGNPSRSLRHTKSFFFYPTIAPHLKCNQTGNTKAVIFTKTTFQRSTQVIVKNPYFCSANRHVDNQLTFTWTTSWSSNQNKVDNQLTLQDIYIYIFFFVL